MTVRKKISQIVFLVPLDIIGPKKPFLGGGMNIRIFSKKRELKYLKNVNETIYEEKTEVVDI